MSTSTPLRRSERLKLGNNLAANLIENRENSRLSRQLKSHFSLSRAQPYDYDDFSRQHHLRELSRNAPLLSPIGGKIQETLNLGGLNKDLDFETPAPIKKSSASTRLLFFKHRADLRDPINGVDRRIYMYDVCQSGQRSFKYSFWNKISAIKLFRKLGTFCALFYSCILFLDLQLFSYFNSRIHMGRQYKSTKRVIKRDKLRRFLFLTGIFLLLIYTLRTCWNAPAPKIGVNSTTTANNESEDSSGAIGGFEFSRSDKNLETLKNLVFNIKSALKELQSRFPEELDTKRLSSSVQTLEKNMAELKSKQFTFSSKLEYIDKALSLLSSAVSSKKDANETFFSRVEDQIKELSKELSVLKSHWPGPADEKFVELNKKVAHLERLLKNYEKSSSEEHTAFEMKIDSLLALVENQRAFEQSLSEFKKEVAALFAAQLTDLELLKKQVSSFKDALIPEASIKSLVDQLYSRKMKEFSQAKVGMTDYASASAGAKIVPRLTTSTREGFWLLKSLFPSVLRRSESWDVVLKSDMEPGHCYALPGQGGSIGIELSEPIIISHFTVEHLPFALTRAPSAPRAMALWGVRSSGEHTNLGTFEYIFSANSESSQTFELKEKHGPFRIVRLEVLSNYGMVQYTCVYRVRVHGEPIRKESNTSAKNSLKKIFVNFIKTLGWT